MTVESVSVSALREVVSRNAVEIHHVRAAHLRNVFHPPEPSRTQETETLSAWSATPRYVLLSPAGVPSGRILAITANLQPPGIAQDHKLLATAPLKRDWIYVAPLPR
jgi:hypothetical protein